HIVLVSDANGNPVAGMTVTWAAASGGGSVDPATSTTDANGHAQTFRTLGVLIGTQTTTATATVAGKDTTVTFSINATAAGASQMTRAGGDGQTGTVGTTLPTQVSVRVTDQFNNPVAGVTVTWTPATGSGSVNPTTSTSNTSGIAATTWTLGTVAGTQTVQATGAGCAVCVGASATAGTATQLVFSVQPSTTAAGAAITPAVQVTAQDAQGNTATGFTGNVTVAIGTNPSTGTLAGTKVVAAVAGVATFANLAIDKVGTGYTLTATGAGSVTSTAFNITAGTATQLAFSVQPSNSVAGSIITPAVRITVEDAFGNRVTSFPGGRPT